MLKLAAIIFIVLAPTLAGAAVIGLLSISFTTSSPTAVALTALGGALVAVPGAWFVARAIEGTRKAA